jgi:hypothetical protein
MIKWNRLKAGLLVGCFFVLFLPACILLSDREYVANFPQNRGINRLAVFLQRWPVYRQLPGVSNLGDDFIKKNTTFGGPWVRASQINPRAVDVLDFDDCEIGKILIKALERQGYAPFLADYQSLSDRPTPVEEIMAKYQVMDPGVDAFIFCFYAPTLFFSDPQSTPKDHGKRPYSLQEVVNILAPGNNRIIWAGPLASQAPRNSISHGFIYLSMTLFRARDLQPLWMLADARVGGSYRVDLPFCPPEPTDQNYPADAAMIYRLMRDNLNCRLRHIIPVAF